MRKSMFFVMVTIAIIINSYISYAQDYSSVIKSAQPLTPSKSESEVKSALLSEKNWLLSYKTYNEGGKHFAVPVYMPGYRAYDVNKRNCLTDINSGRQENMMEVYLRESNAVQIPFLSNPLTKSQICSYINNGFAIGAKPENTTHNYRYKNNYYIEASCQVGNTYYRVWLNTDGNVLALKSSGDIQANLDKDITPKECLAKADILVKKYNKYNISKPVLIVENGNFVVKYYQQYKGITYYDNYVRVEFDKHGNVVQFSNISPDITFIDTNNIMEKKLIVEKIVRFMPVTLDYYYINRYDYNSQNNEPNVNNVSLKYSIKNYSVNAKTGKLIDENGNVVN